MERMIEASRQQISDIKLTVCGLRALCGQLSLSQCAICLDEVQPQLTNVICPGEEKPAHVVCPTCFVGHVRAFATSESRMSKSSSSVECFEQGCQHRFASLDVIPLLAGDVESLALFLQFKTDIETHVVRQEEKERFDEQRRRDEEQAKLNYEEHTSQAEATKITETIFNISCPRCKAVFVDFSGCLALHCKCGCAFCGWCLRDCGADAHACVGMCGTRLGYPGYHHSIDVFNQHHRKRRQTLLDAALTCITSPVIKEKVISKVKASAFDLGLSVAGEASPKQPVVPVVPAVPAVQPAAGPRQLGPYGYRAGLDVCLHM
jgi:hypothetical protein